MDRRTIILEGLDKPLARGLEIGPFFSPIAPKSDGWKTIVVDFKNTQQLRKDAALHPSKAISSMAGNIEEVDVVWKGEPLDELISSQFGAEMDYIIGSHTIEHMVDLLGFFKAAGRLLKPHGVLSLAVPDLRYEFDFFRSPSTLGQVLATHRRKATRHPPEILFDAVAYCANVDGEGCWMPGRYTREINLSATLNHAWQVYQDDLKRAQYIDCHAWCFTPSSFQLLVHELWHLGLADFTLKSINTSAMINTGSEFIVQLVKRDRIAEAVEPIPQSEVESRRKELLLGVISELADRAVNIGLVAEKKPAEF